jgi:S-adenosylmethionine decarboxylase
MFGPHLIIDGSSCNTQKLADRVFIEQFLNSYPAVIGMTKIGGPHIFDYQAPDPAYSGISAFVIIAESHIAIHTFPILDYFTLDVFSCRDFDAESAIAHIQRAFEVKQMDRVLLQRGLSFHGPHHGPRGTLHDSVDQGSHPQQDEESTLTFPDSDTVMSWPTYGMTPDYGTYGELAKDKLVQPPDELTSGTPVLPDIDPVQINPTASISGLIDKMAGASGEARALGRALSIWERMILDPEVHIALEISDPVLASGLREVLVYTVEHRYVDTVVLSAEDLLADLYESLGFAHYAVSQGENEDLILSQDGRQAALACFSKFVHSLQYDTCVNSSDLWCSLGLYLCQHAPRKGLLQAAATSGVRLFTPDLGSSTLGTALRSVSSRGLDIHLPLDLAEEVAGLARVLGRVPRLGIVRVGAGPADALLGQARAVAASLAETTPMFCASVSFGIDRPIVQGDHHTALSSGADLMLPFAITALAQRIPSPPPLQSARHTAPARHSTAAAKSGP